MSRIQDQHSASAELPPLAPDRFDVGSTEDSLERLVAAAEHCGDVFRIHAPGRGPLTVQTIGDDDVVGWSWLIPPYQLRFDVHAVTSTRVLVIDGKCLRGKFAKDPELGYQLMQRFSQVILRRLGAMSIQLLDLYGDHAGEHE